LGDRHDRDVSSARAPGPGRILVVEDDEDSLYTLVMQLSLFGYEDVSVARDGAEAIARLQRADLDLVLLDLMMPDRNGYDVLEWIRSGTALATLPVIVISALDTPDAIVRSIKLGAVDFLSKPVRSDLLRARVEASLERRRPSDDWVSRTQESASADPALLQQTLESLSVGAVVVEADGRILAANGRAAALAADGLRQAGGYLRAEDPESQRALLALIATALQGVAASRAIAIRRPSHRMPLLVRAQTAVATTPRSHPAAALLLIADPESGNLPQVTEELALLGLTPGESRVAALVGCGHSPRDAATKLGIAEETVRSVLKRIYEKLKIRRQGELAAFVAQIAMISSRRSDR
jgi:DNA-binding NarL/FixJ family response regulator